MTKNRLLFTACAVLRKYIYDHYKEVYDLSLEKDRDDRSYQYGRLLAIMEKIEKDALQGSSNRTTYAEKLTPMFVNRPERTMSIIITHVRHAYLSKLNDGARIWYENMIGEIYEKLSTFPPEEGNKKLDESYLFGYYLQRNDFYTKKAETETESK